MNPVELLMLDDEPSGSPCHLTAEQRLNAFERMWGALSQEQRIALATQIPDGV